MEAPDDGEAVPYDRSDPGGEAPPAPFDDAADALRALLRWIERDAAARAAELQLALAPAAPSPHVNPFHARVAETRRRSTLPPLLRAFDAWSLPPDAQTLVAAVLACALEPTVGEALRMLDDGAAPPTLRGLGRLIGCDATDVARALAPVAALVRTSNEPTPATRRASATEWLIQLAGGALAPDPSEPAIGLALEPTGAGTSPFSDETLAELVPLVEREGADEPIGFVTAPPGFGAVGALADELTAAGRAACLVDGRAAGLGAEHAHRVAQHARLFDAVVIVDLPADGDALAGYIDDVAAAGVPLLAVAEALEPRVPPTRVPQARVDIELPTPVVRATLWREALGARVSAAQLPAIGAIFAVGPAMLRAAAAVVLRASDGEVGQAAVGAALAPLARGCLGARARAMPDAVDAAELFVPDDVGEQLVDLAERVRRRASPLHRAAAREVIADAGVCALFTGPPGAGKRLAASVVASALGLSVYAVDAAALATSWSVAGADELARLLRAAERHPVLLVLEHADAFGARNLWPALTAALSRFSGVGIVTSDEERPRERCGDGFAATVHLPMPSEEHRAAIFRAWLPAGAQLDVAWLARRHVCTGGQIRALVVRAAVRAAAADAPLTADAIEAAARELRR